MLVPQDDYRAGSEGENQMGRLRGGPDRQLSPHTYPKHMGPWGLLLHSSPSLGCPGSFDKRIPNQWSLRFYQWSMVHWPSFFGPLTMSTPHCRISPSPWSSSCSLSISLIPQGAQDQCVPSGRSGLAQLNWVPLSDVLLSKIPPLCWAAKSAHVRGQKQKYA